MPAATPKRVAIVGGGLTGLSAAWRLHRDGHSVQVFEKSTRVGGVVTTVERDGWLAEAGPNSIQESPEIAQFIQDLGIAGERVEAGPLAQNRYTVRSGRLMAVPASPGAFFSTSLFSFGAKVRLFAELLHRPRVRTTDTSLGSFIAAHFGQELVDYGLNPVVAGIYAGDPDKLSARYAFPTLWQIERSHGSILRGFGAKAKEKKARGEKRGPAPIVSFAHGLQTLPNAMAASLPPGSVHTHATVTGLIPGKPWKLIWSAGDAVQTGEFDRVLLAVPPQSLAQLVFGTLGERTLATLDHLPQPPVSSLFLGFRRDQVAHPLDGFGALVPALERRQILGALFSSSLFPHRAPDGHVALTVFAGGMRQPDAGRLPTAELLKRVLPDLRELLGVRGDPVFVQHTFWPRAIPQYNLGHERFVEPIAECETRHAGLFIGGTSRDGISMGDCIKSGLKLAARAVEK